MRALSAVLLVALVCVGAPGHNARARVGLRHSGRTSGSRRSEVSCGEAARAGALHGLGGHGQSSAACSPSPDRQADSDQGRGVVSGAALAADGVGGLAASLRASPAVAKTLRKRVREGKRACSCTIDDAGAHAPPPGQHCIQPNAVDVLSNATTIGPILCSAHPGAPQIAIDPLDLALAPVLAGGSHAIPATTRARSVRCEPIASPHGRLAVSYAIAYARRIHLKESLCRVV
jgi:hypothetical protein